MQEILFKNKILSKRGLSKSLKKVMFFLSKPVPFNGQDYERQKQPGISGQSLFRLQNKC